MVPELIRLRFMHGTRVDQIKVYAWYRRKSDIAIHGWRVNHYLSFTLICIFYLASRKLTNLYSTDSFLSPCCVIQPTYAIIKKYYQIQGVPRNMTVCELF